jgi:hypothetical protein
MLSSTIKRLALNEVLRSTGMTPTVIANRPESIRTSDRVVWLVTFQ